MSDKICEFCEIVFVPNRPFQKFCKDKCRTNFGSKKRASQRPKGHQLTHKTCAFCQNLFVTNRAKQKFCNSLCSRRKYEQKPERKHGFKRKESTLKSKLKAFGLTPEDYEYELQNQNHVCAICGKAETDLNMGTLRRLAVDHDHKTGRYRGLLCGKCNKGIGLLQDDIAILKQAIQYLENFGGTRDDA